uniref:Kae1-like domain-containing protein n=1 Tax=Segatella copri TaxID=165179 RepID=UPI001F325400
CQTAALSGGVYQNALLLRLTEEGLTANGYHVLTHQMIPPNDGGVAVGQAFYGMNHERQE